MKIYKNPWVSRPCYFVPTRTARSAKMEPAKRAGITVTLLNGEWLLRTSQMYVKDISEMPVVGEISKDARTHRRETELRRENVRK